MKNTHPRDEDEEDVVDSSTAINLKRAALDVAYKALGNALAKFEDNVKDVRMNLCAHMQAHSNLADTLAEAESAMKSTHADWEMSIAICDSLISKPADEVRFKACGTEFMLSADTLRKYPGSFFGTYVCGRWEVKAEPLSLECDARIFAHIVRYMLYGTLDVSAMTGEERRLLKLEADKFVLTGLSDLVASPRLPPSSPSVVWVFVHKAPNVVKEDGCRLHSPYGLNSYSTICANGSIGWTSGVHEWAVYRNVGSDNLIGVSYGSISAKNRSNNEHQMKVVNLSTGHVRLENANIGPAVFNRREDVETYHVRLDMNARTVTFGVNYIWNSSPTFTNLSPVAWFPYFDLCHQGASMTLLSQN